jgi:probable F420-dependent oxidoreductase
MPGPPTLGLFALNHGPAAREALGRVGPLAEELGYDWLVVGEHVVVPDPRVKPSPMEPDDPILDGVVSLAFLAARTERIRLVTGIVILPQRNPLVLAKQLASVDSLSGGRLVFGLGVGYLEPEMSAIGVPMERRGRRADEYLAAIRALWEQEKPSFEGEFVSFSGINAYPRPVQRPLPVIVGGRTPAAHRRAARHGDGWYGFWLDLDRTADQLDGIEAALAEAGRGRSDLDVTVTPRGRIDAGAVAAYESLGVDRLVLIVPSASPIEEIEEFVRDHAPARIGATPAS